MFSFEALMRPLLYGPLPAPCFRTLAFSALSPSSVQSGKTQPCQGSTCISPAYIRNNSQFKHCNPRKIDAMIFSLTGCALGAEVPLLAYDLSERLPAILRPSEDELLGAHSVGLDELQPDSAEPLRMGEEKPDRLLSWLRSTPARASRQQCGLDRMCRIFRSDFDLCHAIEIQPVLVVRRGLSVHRRNGAFARLRAS